MTSRISNRQLQNAATYAAMRSGLAATRDALLRHLPDGVATLIRNVPEENREALFRELDELGTEPATVYVPPQEGSNQ